MNTIDLGKSGKSTTALKPYQTLQRQQSATSNLGRSSTGSAVTGLTWSQKDARGCGQLGLHKSSQMSSLSRPGASASSLSSLSHTTDRKSAFSSYSSKQTSSLKATKTSISSGHLDLQRSCPPLLKVTTNKSAAERPSRSIGQIGSFSSRPLDGINNFQRGFSQSHGYGIRTPAATGGSSPGTGSFGVDLKGKGVNHISLELNCNGKKYSGTLLKAVKKY